MRWKARRSGKAGPRSSSAPSATPRRSSPPRHQRTPRAHRLPARAAPASGRAALAAALPAATRTGTEPHNEHAFTAATDPVAAFSCHGCTYRRGQPRADGQRNNTRAPDAALRRELLRRFCAQLSIEHIDELLALGESRAGGRAVLLDGLDLAACEERLVDALLGLLADGTRARFDKAVARHGVLLGGSSRSGQSVTPGMCMRCRSDS